MLCRKIGILAKQVETTMPSDEYGECPPEPCKRGTMKKALIITYIIASHIVFLCVITAIKRHRTNDFHERLWQEMSWNGFCYSRIKEINDGKVLPADELRLWQKIAWASALYAYKQGTLDYILSRRIKREQIRT